MEKGQYSQTYGLELPPRHLRMDGISSSFELLRNKLRGVNGFGSASWSLSNELRYDEHEGPIQGDMPIDQTRAVAQARSAKDIICAEHNTALLTNDCSVIEMVSLRSAIEYRDCIGGSICKRFAWAEGEIGVPHVRTQSNHEVRAPRIASGDPETRSI